MGTSIELTVSNVSLDYAKNFMGNDYGFLFQETDLVLQPGFTPALGALAPVTFASALLMSPAPR
jgi:hypothetical protein